MEPNFSSWYLCVGCILLHVPMHIDSGSVQIDKLWLMAVYVSVQFTRIGKALLFCFHIVCSPSPGSLFRQDRRKRVS